MSCARELRAGAVTPHPGKGMVVAPLARVWHQAGCHGKGGCLLEAEAFSGDGHFAGGTGEVFVTLITSTRNRPIHAHSLPTPRCHLEAPSSPLFPAERGPSWGCAQHWCWLLSGEVPLPDRAQGCHTLVLWGDTHPISYHRALRSARCWQQPSLCLQLGQLERISPRSPGMNPGSPMSPCLKLPNLLCALASKSRLDGLCAGSGTACALAQPHWVTNHICSGQLWNKGLGAPMSRFAKLQHAQRNQNLLGAFPPI